jgi:hypothetical protein
LASPVFGHDRFITSLEAELQLDDDAKFAPHSLVNRGHFTPWTAPTMEPTHNPAAGLHGNASSKSDLMVLNAKKPSQPAASAAVSSNSMPRNRDMNCHTCGGRGHIKKDCPNRKVMLINEETAEYETRDDADPELDCLQDDEDGSLNAYATHLPTIVCSPKVLSVTPSSADQRFNLFQTKAIVGPGKACRVIIDGDSCHNLASKELCSKLNLKYFPHPNPNYIQWLSDSGEMKISYMVRVEFQIRPYKDTVECDVVPMTVCHLLLGRPWQYGRDVRHNGRENTYNLNWHGNDITLQPMTLQQIVNESRQKIEVSCEKEHERLDRQETPLSVSESHKPNMSSKKKCGGVKSLVVLAAKTDLREFHEDPTAVPFVLTCKRKILISNNMTPLSIGVSNVL